MSEFKFYPQVVVWEVTFACNMRCLHCGTSAGKIRPNELTTDEALHLIDELADLGCNTVNISGGEPLLRRDWKQLTRRMKDRNIKAYMITNGFLVTEETIADFREVGLDFAGVSLDGTEKTHNYIRQHERSWKNAVNAMRLMHKHDFPFCAVSQISNINLGELDEIRKILIDAGCKLWRIQMTTSTGRMVKDMVLTLENYPKLIDKCLEFKELDGIRIDVGENIGYYGCKGSLLRDNMPYLGCYAGTRIAGIESDGSIKGCLSMPEQFVEGNIRDSSFTEIWNNPDGFAYNRRFTKETADGACRECRYLPLCRGGCTTTSVSASGHRADNPYCMYQLELKQGIQPPPDGEVVTQLLDPFREK